MNPFNEATPRFGVPANVQWSRAFTLVESFLIIIIICLLGSVQFAAMTKAKHHTTVAACAANLRQGTMAFHIYGTENNDKLPAAAGYWAWDMPLDLGVTLGRYGAPKSAWYCPASPDNADRLWNYVPNNYRVVRYALTLAGGPSLSSTNWNPTLTPQPISYGPIILPPPLASRRVLVADATLSQPGQDNEADRASYNYLTVQGSYPGLRGTSHVDRSLPAGGNLGMMDGHVEWRTFQNMHVRTPPGSITPVFWW